MFVVVTNTDRHSETDNYIGVEWVRVTDWVRVRVICWTLWPAHSTGLQWRRNWGFRRFNEPGPRAPGGPRVRGQKNYARKEYAASEKLIN